MSSLSLKRKIGLMQINAEKALKEAVAEVVRDHQRTGDPLAIWRDGKVVWVSAEKLLPHGARRKSTKRP